MGICPYTNPCYFVLVLEQAAFWALFNSRKDAEMLIPCQDLVNIAFSNR